MSTSALPGNFGNAKASWVAVFILFLLWWLARIPKLFASKEDVTEEAAVDTPGKDIEGHEAYAYSGKEERTRSVERHFRDGLIFLITAVAIQSLANGPRGASNALAWIFTGFWILIGIARYFLRKRRVLELLSLLDVILLVALISNAFAHPRNIF